MITVKSNLASEKAIILWLAPSCKIHISLSVLLEISVQFAKANPVRAQRHFNVHTTSSQRYGQCMDVETMLCEYSQ